MRANCASFIRVKKNEFYIPSKLLARRKVYNLDLCMYNVPFNYLFKKIALRVRNLVPRSTGNH